MHPCKQLHYPSEWAESKQQYRRYMGEYCESRLWVSTVRVGIWVSTVRVGIWVSTVRILRAACNKWRVMATDRVSFYKNGNNLTH